MSLDPQARAQLDAAAALGLPPREQGTPEQARANFVEQRRRLGAPSAPIHSVEDGRLPGPAGELAMRIYRPSATRPLPLLVYFHGGGWVSPAGHRATP